MIELINKLEKNKNLSPEEFKILISCDDSDVNSFLCEKARKVSLKSFGNKIYIRGLIEFTNICKNNCYYCGIRKDNSNVQRYRLSKQQILESCKIGYELGFRTFVLQGGEDGFFTDSVLVDIVSGIKKLYNDCAVTLSIGERSKQSYQDLFDAGADRFLLRHETANDKHYLKLHPDLLSLKNRKRCLFDLKDIHYQVGSGFMVGSPFQSVDNLVEDLVFLKQLDPEMIGIGPFISHKDTPFKDEKSGSVDLTIKLVSILRLMFPKALIPATTAVATLGDCAREKAILSGANVVMPNLSPINIRNMYSLYNNKKNTNQEAAENINLLKKELNKIGYEIVVDRGDYKK